MQSLNRYASLRLEANPFPLTPIPSRIWILGGSSRIRALERIREEIAYSFRLEEPKIDIVIGDTGSGKTHIALHLQYILSQEKPIQLVSYISTIQDSVYKPSLIFFTSKVIESLGGEVFLKELSMRLHQQLISKMSFEFFSKTVNLNIVYTVLLQEVKRRRELFNKILSDFRYTGDFIEKDILDLDKLVRLELEKLKEIFETRFEPSRTRRFVDLSIVKWILWIPHPYYGSWGMKHLTEYLKESDDNALRFLTTIVNLAKFVSNTPFIIMVDEVETLTQDNVEVFFHSLKRIVDSGPGGLFILLLLTPVMFEELGSQRFRIAPAIVSRVSSNPISLEKINVDEAKDIIDRYVKALYLDKNSEGYLNMFPMDTVKILWANSGGEIRRLLSECFNCIEILADRLQKRITKSIFVDTAIATEAVMKMGLPATVSAVPLEPDSDVRSQIMARFYNIEKNSERSTVLQKAVSILIEKGFGDVSLLGRKRISVSLTRKREVDLVFLDRDSNVSVGVIIKAPRLDEGVGRDFVEPLMEITGSGKLGRVFFLTTSPIDPESQKTLESFKNLRILVLNDKEVSMLIYVSQVFRNLSRPVTPTPEESIEVLRRIGLLD
ncbi:MAG: hypothetical protein ACUVQ0_01495 [Thermoproteota archaeon]